MPKRKVYFRENRLDKIRWHSWPNTIVLVEVQFDDLCIFTEVPSTEHKIFRGFHRHFKLLQPLEIDF